MKHVIEALAAVAHLHLDKEVPEERLRFDWNDLQKHGGPHDYVHPADFWRTRLAKLGGSSVLDIGGGNGVLCADHWNRASITVVDVAPNPGISFEGLHLITADAEEALSQMKPKSFDVIQFTECLEHMRKAKGRRVLAMLPSIARKGIIVTTPCGYSFQPEHLGNPYNVHVSGWLPKELEAFGYEIYLNGGRGGAQIFATMVL